MELAARVTEQLALNSDEVRRIVSYCSEEVRRQQDGPLHVGCMVDAWVDALEHTYEGDTFTLEVVEEWGRRVAPDDNALGFRYGNVWIAGRMGVRPDALQGRLERWLTNLPDMEVIEAYKEFEFIHPFFDGNGRTGKIILNYLNGSLLDPIFPPAGLFGEPIANP